MSTKTVVSLLCCALSVCAWAGERQSAPLEPKQVVQRLVANAKKGKPGVFSLLHDSALEPHVSASLKRLLEVLEAEEKALKNIPGATDEYSSMIDSAQCHG